MGGRGGVLTVAVVGVHVEVWNLPAVDAGIRPSTVAVLAVAAHGYCQHRAPARDEGGEREVRQAVQNLPWLQGPEISKGGQKELGVGTGCATQASYLSPGPIRFHLGRATLRPLPGGRGATSPG